MPAVVRTAAADDDLRNIAVEVGIRSGRPAVADRVIDGLLDCCNELAHLSAMSKLGTPTPQLGPGIRIYSYRRWAIIFRYIVDGILVLRIADGSQDYLTWKFGGLADEPSQSGSR